MSCQCHVHFREQQWSHEVLENLPFGEGLGKMAKSLTSPMFFARRPSWVLLAWRVQCYLQRPCGFVMSTSGGRERASCRNGLDQVEILRVNVVNEGRHRVMP